jgi:2-C-methyl-D-erythritol 4-phosphate cytidylyltransferase
MNTAIIVAAGEGKRAGGETRKQFREIAGAPIIIHTLRRFEACASIARVALVLPAAEAVGFHETLARYGLRKVTGIVAGGASRMESVWRGLQAIEAGPTSIIAIHDGVRPLVAPAEIDATVRAAAETGAAILAAPIVDTVKEADDARAIVRTVERAHLYRALTPQCFRFDLLRRAYESARRASVEATDDSSLVERLGTRVHIVEGSARNIKITHPDDFIIAAALLNDAIFVRSGA